MPNWLDYELYTKENIKDVLNKQDKWVLGSSETDSVELIIFGAWISDKQKVMRIMIYQSILKNAIFQNSFYYFILGILDRCQ